MLALLGFFQTPLGRQVGLALAVFSILASLYGLARHQGADSIRKADQKATASAKAQVAKINEKAAQISDNSAKEASLKQAKIQTDTASALHKVKPHVPPTDPHFYVWPRWSVFAYNASLGLPDVPDTSGKPDDSASTLGAADALPVVISNNGVCRANSAQLEALQGWVRAQAGNR